MDRLAALFEQLPVPEIARLLRRAAISGLAVGTVALVLGIVFGHPLAGLGAVLGLGLGLLNIRLITRSVLKVNAAEVANPKRVLAGRTLVRLAGTTTVVIGLLLVSVQLGFGTAGGIAVFYFLLLANLVRSILQQGTRGVPA